MSKHLELNDIKEKVKTLRTISENKEIQALCSIVDLLVSKLEEKEAGFSKS